MPDAARALARSARARHAATAAARWSSSRSAAIADGPRFGLVASPRPLGHPVMRRLRMIAAVARQGFALCAARDRPTAPAGGSRRSLARAAAARASSPPAPRWTRVVEQIQRLQGNDLTVLITGESGTGKELVARAIHVGSHRSAAMFLPYNCTTTGRELADSQLFGHRRGSFTGAVSDQPGLVRSAAGGTLFLDEIGDLPLDVQPKLLRFLEQQEIMPIGETRPQRVDVRVLAATNADLEQRVAEGKFREDLYYRLSVIRIHVPPLRERREEIPHLSDVSSCARRSERLGKPDVHLSSEVARRVLAVLVAGQRPAAEERDPARRRAERARRHDRARRTSRPKSARTRLPATGHGRRPVGRRRARQPRDGRRAGRARPDSGGARSEQRQHLGNGPDARPDPPRAVSQASSAWTRVAGPKSILT